MSSYNEKFLKQVVGGGGKVEPSAWAFDGRFSGRADTAVPPPPHMDQFLDSWEDLHSSSHGDHQGSHPRPPLQPRTLPTERWTASSRGMRGLRIEAYTDKKENQIFLISKEIQNGTVAKPFMRKGCLRYEEMRKYLLIYEEDVSHI
jgi:hypothetical protein